MVRTINPVHTLLCSSRLRQMPEQDAALWLTRKSVSDILHLFPTQTSRLHDSLHSNTDGFQVTGDLKRAFHFAFQSAFIPAFRLAFQP
jgi:hypothetical protein